MIKVRKRYDRIFKERAVELSKTRKNLSELARELGISAAQLYKWRKESEEFGSGSFPWNGNIKQTPEQEQISFLEKKFKDSELELEILKKLTLSIYVVEQTLLRFLVKANNIFQFIKRRPKIVGINYDTPYLLDNFLLN